MSTKNIDKKTEAMAIDTTQPTDEGRPMSVVIRERVAASKKRYFANDNISAFIEPGDMDKLLDEVESKMKGVLDSMVSSPRGQNVFERGVQRTLSA